MKIKTLLALVSLGGAFLSSWAGDYDKELAAVKAGTCAEAKASWWGFNKEDATPALQAAINSGVKRLVVDNVGSPWAIEPVSLVDNQEIVFEPGVVVVAKKGAFKNPCDCLFSATGKKNITLRGQGGVVLEMRKADYNDALAYKVGEWRHALALYSCESIVIRGLTLRSSGGDGIYVGCQAGNPMAYCKDIQIEGVTCDDNHRQGISVISAENLTIKNSVFKNTRGTSPAAGIDFEPNARTERLVNCVLDNCAFTGNDGSGIDFYLRTDIPLSISIRNCRITGNGHGVRYGVVDGQETVSDNIEFVGCFVGSSANANVHIQGANTRLRFKDCVIDNRGNKRQAITICERWDHSAEGVIEFEDVTVLDDAPGHAPLSVSSYLPRPKLATKGRINFNQPGMASTLMDCSKKLSPAYEGEFLAAAPIDLNKLVAPRPGAPTAAASSIIPVRDKGKFLQFAEKGRKLALEAMGVKVGSNDGEISMLVKSPRGGEVTKFDLTPGHPWRRVEFTPAETGIYTVECVENRGNAFRLRSATPGNGHLAEGAFRLVSPKGKLFFQVPAGVGDIKIEVAGDEGEPLDICLVNPAGAVVQRLSKVEATKLLSFKRASGAQAEIWSVEFSNALEDSTIRLGANLVPVLSERAEDLPLLP